MLLCVVLRIIILLLLLLLLFPVLCIHNISDLELERHGLKLLPRSPSSFTPCLDGRYLLLGPDAELNHSEISKFSKRDANAYPRCIFYLQMILDKCSKSRGFYEHLASSSFFFL
jgi:phytoene dehydrogenase-like protein